jgi:hypothetical protein
MIGAATGFFLGGIVGRLVFRAPSGQTVVAPIGASSLGVAIKGSLAGGFVVAILVAVGLLVGIGIGPAGIAVLAGASVVVGVGCLATLL